MARAARDGYQTVEVADFGGLDLRRDPQDARPVRAIDLLNVELENNGRVRSRAGTTRLVSQSTTTGWGGLIAFNPGGLGTPQIITVVGMTGQLRAYNASTGALVTTFSPTGPSLPSSIKGSAMIGQPTDTAVMYLNVADGDKLIKYNGTTFSEGTNGGQMEHLAVQYPDNRLVMANYSPLSTFNSRVLFSAANDPENFTNTSDYVDLLPGDGEQIVGLANFRDFLIAFKQSAFYVFYGNSTDSVGGTVFNYRIVRHNLATPAYAAKICAAGREGVYFLAKDGIYLTDGGYPRKISQALDPLFRGADDAGYFTGAANIGGATFSSTRLDYADGRLYLAAGSTGKSNFFVYDPRVDAWTYWELLPGLGMEVFGVTSALLPGAKRETPYFLTGGGTTPNIVSVISYLDPTSILDEGHALWPAFNSYYQSNFLDLGTSGAQKVVREIEIEGSMSARALGLYPDNVRGSVAGGSFPTVTTVAPTGTPAPTWPGYAVGRARARRAYRGRNFSLAVAGSPAMSNNSPWVLHRALLHLRGERPAGVSGT